MTFWVQRLENEWRLAWQQVADDDFPELPEVNQPAAGEPPEAATFERVTSHRPGHRLIVSARLADRSIVARPEKRFRLLPEGKIDLYISTPLWVVLETAEPRQKLLDVPTRRPSDSWFGPSTTDGELCYAARTAPRLRRDNLPSVSHRATTRVHLVNRADDDLVLERINLPVPHLALFTDGDRLWTQTVSVERGTDGKLAQVRFDNDPSPKAAAVRKLAEPRVGMTTNVFSRALGALLG